MKKIFYFAAAAMIAAIAGCTEDIIAPDNQEDSGQETVSTGNDSGLMPHKTIKVSSADTRTSLSGLQILWDEGDQISLFNQDGQLVSASGHECPFEARKACAVEHAGGDAHDVFLKQDTDMRYILL